MKLAAFLLTLLVTTGAFAQSAAPQNSHAKGAHAWRFALRKAPPNSTVRDKQVIQATDAAPEFIQLAKNVEVIPNIEDAVKSRSAVLTHEGLFGPLLFAEQNRAFFIQLKPGHVPWRAST